MMIPTFTQTFILALLYFCVDVRLFNERSANRWNREEVMYHRASLRHYRGLPLWVKCVKGSDLQDFQANFGEEIRQKSYSKP